MVRRLALALTLLSYNSAMAQTYVVKPDYEVYVYDDPRWLKREVAALLCSNEFDDVMVGGGEWAVHRLGGRSYESCMATARAFLARPQRRIRVLDRQAERLENRYKQADSERRRSLVMGRLVHKLQQLQKLSCLIARAQNSEPPGPATFFDGRTGRTIVISASHASCRVELRGLHE